MGSAKKIGRLARNFLLATFASLFAAMTIKEFAIKGGLVSSGFSGLSILICKFASTYLNLDFSYSIVYLLLNLPALLLVIRSIGIRFTAISVYHIVLTSLLVEIMPILDFTNDLLLLSVFGGVISGVANAMIVYGEGCGGGIDFIAIHFANIKKESMWNFTLAANAIILTISGLLFGWTAALYSIIYQYVATKVLNGLDIKYKRVSMFVVSDKADEINALIKNKYDHSSSEIKCIGGYSRNVKKLLYIVVGTYEASVVSEDILKIDETAFINVVSTKRLIGKFSEKSYYLQ